MIELLMREGRPTDALTFAEYAKARVLLDVLKTGRVNSAKAMTGQEQEQESKLRSELVSLNTQVTRASQQDNPDQARLDGLKSLREKARLEYEAFQISLYAAHPELRAQRGDAPVVKGDEIAALLPDAGSALLEYLVTDETTYLFAITKSDGSSPGATSAFALQPEDSINCCSNRLWRSFGAKPISSSPLTTSFGICPSRRCSTGTDAT
jgi:hypothetical protein